MNNALKAVREAWNRMTRRTRILLIAILSVTLIGVIVAVVALNSNKKTVYSTLFTGLSQDEAQQIVTYLQDQSIEYTYDASTGSIRIPDTSVDQTRAALVSQGYPKSGFTYSMYISNAGLMTTESDKQQYTLYDLQDRLGATIRLFDGVQDARVTIATGTDSNYALNSDSETVDATASVVVTMKSDSTLTVKNANAIKNLIARSVRGMNFTNVSVFDAATMSEVGSDTETDSDSTGTSVQELTTLVENNMANNVRRVFAKLYGSENIAVSVKGTLNMEKLIEENTQYSVPATTSETDKEGLLSHEEVAGENSGATNDNEAGVVGSDANADTPRYTYQTGDGTLVEGYWNNSATRDWLYNILKQQREIPAGVLENATVAVVVDTDDTSIPEADLINLAADAAGIDRTNAANKITIIRASQKKAEETTAPTETEPTGPIPGIVLPDWPIAAWIGIAAGTLLFLLLFILIHRRRKKKRLAKIAKEKAEAEAREAAAQAELEEAKRRAEEAERLAAEQAKEPEDDIGAEQVTNEAMEHGNKLKQAIGDFVDNNPQVVAKLLQGWIREEEEQAKAQAKNRRKSAGS